MAESKSNSWIDFKINQKDQTDGTISSPIVSSSPSSPGPKISPAVLFVIVILAVLFFISGLLHLLIRFLVKKKKQQLDSPASNGHRESTSTASDALQRQLQQLFHLHDSGLDQAFIDALPVFDYKEIVGAKESFDCAICLIEFAENDKLRLLPICSHAFHIKCIDTWLLSNSTCPLCRGTLYAPIDNVVFDFDDSMVDEALHKNIDMEEIKIEKGILSVRLGKFRKLNDEKTSEGKGETSSSNLDARRCFSMGSYEYVLGDSDLRVSLSNGDSSIGGDADGKKIINVRKGESFSVSKIWLWSKKGKFQSNNQLGTPYSPRNNPPWMQEHHKK